MKKIIKKLGTLIITLFVISVITFLAFRLIPGDAVTSKLGTEATPERIEAMREALGYHKPLWQQYVNWAGNFLRGNMGTSYTYEIPVSQLLIEKVVITGILGTLSFLFILFLSFPLGILFAKWKPVIIEELFFFLNQVIMAVPGFFMGLLLTLLFGFVFSWFQPGNYIPYTESVGGFLRYMIPPAIAIALPKSAMVMKLLKENIEGEMKKDYVRTMRSKGGKEGYILWKHVLKNASIPVVTFLGLLLADLVAGSLIVEQVFGIPGLGRLLISSISTRDYPVVMSIIMIISIFVIVVNAVVDIIYKRLDPRISK